MGVENLTLLYQLHNQGPTASASNPDFKNAGKNENIVGIIVIMQERAVSEGIMFNKI
jgi:hypothetical protein